ncbi:aminotransferase class I/II-fold pyridoxal phosphate-dependent enzyme [Flagellimonas sp.]|uniref:pyridoxal phosphate-dependent decarboxylase family protein n=1 Tax=Flagellimonas sp. TaxID=2058762 RepID=UPI003F49DFF5
MINLNSDLQFVVKALNAFHKESIFAQKPVINQEVLQEIIENLALQKWAKRGGLHGEELSSFMHKYLSLNTRLHHPGYLGHQCAAPHYSAALGSFVNSFTNNVSAIYEMGPASVALEYFIVNWMLEKVGWPTPESDHMRESLAGGVLVNGGSIANLTALIVARSHKVPKVWEQGNPTDLAVMLPSESHYSLSKAAGIMGMGKNAIHYLDVDSRGAIISDKLPKALQNVLDKGLRPFALIANSCNTPVGVYDPLDEIADFCNENELWLHVDGAHGASALLSDKHKHRLRGIHKADSLTWDAHKLLQTPSLCAALLVKDHQHLDNGMPVGDNASYLFHEKDQPGCDSLHRTIETTKSGLGEKLFFVMAALGEKGLVNFIDERYQLTLEAHNFINGLPDFYCPVIPESNILCFKFQGNDEDQIVIRKKLLEKGDFYLTSTMFKGVRYLRLVFMSPNTKLHHIKILIQSIREIASTKTSR